MINVANLSVYISCLCRLVCLAGACLPILPAFAQAKYTVQDLGALFPQATVTVKGINNKGEIVGFVSPSPKQWPFTAFL